MGFWGGMAIGVLLCFVLFLVFDKPETVINGKNKVKNGGQIDYKLNSNKDGNNKRALGRVATRINGIFKGGGKSNTKRKRQ